MNPLPEIWMHLRPADFGLEMPKGSCQIALSMPRSCSRHELAEMTRGFDRLRVRAILEGIERETERGQKGSQRGVDEVNRKQLIMAYQGIIDGPNRPALVMPASV